MTFKTKFLKPLLCLLLITISINFAQAQKKEPFSFAMPTTKVQNSIYSKITFIDQRTDTSQLGRVLTGAFNRQAVVIPKESLQTQFSNILNALTDAKGEQGELLLHLRQLNFLEQTDGYVKTGSFFTRAELYAKIQDGYKLLSKLDTGFAVKYSDNDLLLENGGNILTYFIANNLTKIPAGNTYVLKDVVGIDSIEKRSIKLFTTDSLADGFYANYYTFQNQLPDGEIYIEGDSVKSNNVKAYDAKRKLKKLKPNTVYAIVFKGQAYIGTGNQYAPVKKLNNNLIFISQTGGPNNASKDAAIMGATAGYGAIGGAVGGLASALTTPKTRNFETQIDHLTGKFILLHEAP